MPNNKSEYSDKWEEELDPNGMPCNSWCKRQDSKYAWCTLCKKPVKVEGMGKSAISQHAEGKRHIEDTKSGRRRKYTKSTRK